MLYSSLIIHDLPSQLVLATNDIVAGVYMLQLKNEDGSLLETLKLVVLH